MIRYRHSYFFPYKESMLSCGRARLIDRQTGVMGGISMSKTPKVFNLDNPVQAEGAARGKEWRTAPCNPVGVELSITCCCAPTEHRRDVACRVFTPSCAPLARGYHEFASYGGGWHHSLPPTVALGYCLDRYALSERMCFPGWRGSSIFFFFCQEKKYREKILFLPPTITQI